MAKFKQYEYEWMDHYSMAGWIRPNTLLEEKEPYIIHGVGYLVHENKDYYFFSQGLAPKNQVYNDVMACLKKTTKLKKLIKTVDL